MKCQDKIAYWFEDDAYDAMKYKHKKGYTFIRYYLCPICNNFHLTSALNRSHSPAFPPATKPKWYRY